MPEAELKSEMKKVNGIFEMKVKNAKGKEGVWTIDMKKVRRFAASPLSMEHVSSRTSRVQEGKVYKGPAKPKVGDLLVSLRSDRGTHRCARRRTSPSLSPTRPSSR